MHPLLVEVQTQLRDMVAKLTSTVPSNEPFSNAHSNWTFPGLTRAELVEEADSIVRTIDERGRDEIHDAEPLLQDYIRRLQYLTTATIPNLWSNAAQGVSAYMLTLQGLRKALEPALKTDAQAQAAQALRKATHQLRAMQSRLNALEPRTNTLSDMLERIENAYESADQLPSDLESLSEARGKIDELLEASIRDQGRLVSLLVDATTQDAEVRRIAAEAASTLKRCEQAYSASTSVGLAAAFSDRARSLAFSMWTWVIGLIAALATGSYFGTTQLRALTELFKAPNIATPVIAMNMLLSLLSVAAPVWFAWLATKQVGQRFRLAEDYAFKATISRAYEGYRQEAHRIDASLEARLLESALTRLDELPLRLVESNDHGSPWHELLSSSVVKHAVRAVPDFADQVRQLADKALAATLARGKPTEAESK